MNTPENTPLGTFGQVAGNTVWKAPGFVASKVKKVARAGADFAGRIDLRLKPANGADPLDAAVSQSVAAMREKMLCGHPYACVVKTETGLICSACKELERAVEMARMQLLVELTQTKEARADEHGSGIPTLPSSPTAKSPDPTHPLYPEFA